jgi:signal transduction histidine kinase
MEGIFKQGTNRLERLKNADLIRRAFINMLEDMHWRGKQIEVSQEKTRRALINMLEDLKKSKDVLEKRNKELENALRQLKETTERLIQTEKIRALGEAMVGLSHDIKNILNGLEAGMFIMDQGLKQGSLNSIAKGWEIEKRNIARIKDLSLDMLFYAKFRKPEYQLADVNQIVQEVCELLQGKAKERKINLTWKLDSSLKQARIDPKGIYRCLLNLVTNALEACSSSDSYVTVKVVGISKENRLQIEVSDTGRGIPQDRIKDIFTPFHSTKGYGGTGLGLAVAHKIISEHKGSILVNSQVQKGTTLVINLPIRETKGSAC